MAERKWSKQSLSNFRKYQNEFNKETYKGYSFRLNKESEAYIIDYIEKYHKGKITSYIRDLIIKDMIRNNVKVEELQMAYKKSE